MTFLFLTLCLFLSTVSSIPLLGSKINKIVVFGDSLSDGGKGTFQLFAGQTPLPPYFGGRFSNGLVWPEYVFPPAIDPFHTRKLINMAYGGGLINQTGFQNAPVSLMAQINDYLLTQGFDLGSTADTTQYIFQGGPNDIWFAPMNNETMTASGPTGRLAELPTAIPFMVTWQISKLIQAGAKNILVILLPPLHRVPESIAQLSPAELLAFSQFLQQINAGIRAGLASINSTAVSLKVFDSYAFTEGLISKPQKYGLKVLNQPCFANYNAFLRGKGGVPPVVCQHPETYLFWDGAGHPTTTVHNLVGLQVRGLIGLS